MYEIYETKERITADNDKEAAKNRALLKEKKVFLVNLMASPGAGKTTTLVRTINAIKDDYRVAVMEADVDSDVDAETIDQLGVKVIQLHTGGLCHMDADMTERALDQMGIDDVDVVFLENIGNLVCPAEFDVGAAKKVMILSVPEGDDKPLKYPLMFQVSDLLLINKIDTKAIFDFDENRCAEYVHKLNPDMKIIPLSAKTGEGFEEWIAWLKIAIEEWRNA
ncbi:MAG: hydrogenase nickel incorporation protein HypB [Solobacterium sp.]|nr:hydrogenase nickel incorporation protein HypB [Solobacterium sp.]MBQ9824586.1 hydrogenase nickel incorporation protein HypB [Solobacterium sp.]